jgi:hypothetical protein
MKRSCHSNKEQIVPNVIIDCDTYLNGIETNDKMI